MLNDDPSPGTKSNPFIPTTPKPARRAACTAGRGQAFLDSENM
jgi:hypothetical protein